MCIHVVVKPDVDNAKSWRSKCNLKKEDNGMLTCVNALLVVRLSM